MHEIRCLFSLVRLLFKWKTALNIVSTQENIVLKTVCRGIGDSQQTFALQ